MKGSKEMLRRKYLEIRQLANQHATPSVWAKMREHLWSLPGFSDAKTILLYSSKDTEAPTTDLIQKALDEGRRVALPIAHAKERTMELSFIRSLDDLVPSSFGVLEPKLSSLSTCAPSEVQCALVPGIAFDLEGYRLGWGLGFYDRFLPSLSCPTIGFCYEAQIAPKLPHEKFDVPVKAIITEVSARAIIHKEK
jgi:5-formyltetrahydrofolate cyclo-ligase